MVTSTIPSEGKTLISINLARSLSLMEKSVLLIGGDIRNPKLSHDLGIERVVHGFSSLLAGMDKDYKNLIKEMYPNLHILQSGAVPPNPNELFSRPALEQLFVRLRREYDYIVIDSAPVGVVSDSFMLNRISDLTLYIMREKLTQKDTVHFLNSIKRDGRLKNLAVVLNGSSLDGKYGNYKYGYKYSYRYGYSQHYGYKQEKQKA